MQFWRSLLFLTIINFIVYIPSFFNPFIWDDEQFIYNNEYVKSFNVVAIFTQNTIAGAGEISHYFRPLTTLSFAVDYLFWGSNPFGFHLVNTLIHISAGVFLALYLYNIKLSKNSILIITTIFLLHPIQTEAVTYINSRGDSLYTLLLFIGLTAFSLYLKDRKLAYTLYDLELTINKNKYLVIIVVSFFLSILAKELAIAGIGLYFITWLFFVSKGTDKNIKKKGFVTLSTVSVLALLYGMARMTFWHFQQGYQVDLESSAYYSSIFVRFLTLFKVLWLYLGILFVPIQLHMERSTPEVLTVFNPWLGLTLLLMCVIMYLAKRERTIFKSNTILFGSAWFVGLFIPISGIIPSVGMLYEHWLYLPHIGGSIIVTQLARMYLKTNLVKKLYFPVLVVLIITLSCLTLYQNYIWGDKIRFFSHVLQFSQTARLHNNLAMAYAEKNELSSAIEHYNKAIELGDYYPQTHFNLGNSYIATDNIPMAIVEYEKAIAMNPNFLHAYIPLIQAYSKTKQYNAAIAKSSYLVSIQGSNIDLILLHASLLWKNNQIEEAEQYFSKALTLSNNSPSVANNVQSIKKETTK